MKTLVKLLLVCVCIEAFIGHTAQSATFTDRQLVKMSVRTKNLGKAGAIPQGMIYGLLVEIHENDIAGLPTNGLFNGAYMFPFDKLLKDFLVAVKNGTGTTLRKLVSLDSNGWLTTRGDYVTRENYFCFVTSVYSIIDHDPIPLSYWDTPSGELSTGTRVLIHGGGTSMFPTFPLDAILAAIVGVPYEEVKEETTVAYLNPVKRKKGEWWPKINITVHRTKIRWFDGSWTMLGDNNRDVDPYRLNHWNCLGVVGKVYQDLTPSNTKVVSNGL